MNITEEFITCLNTISHIRAGWDYDLPADRRALEDEQGSKAMGLARAIWTGNPDRHDALRAAHAFVLPLVSMREIEAA